MVGGTLLVFIGHVVLHKWERFCDCRRLKKIENKMEGGCCIGNRGKEDKRRRSLGPAMSNPQQSCGVSTPDTIALTPNASRDGIHKISKKVKDDTQSFFVSNSCDIEDGLNSGFAASFNSSCNELGPQSFSKRGLPAEDQEIVQKRRELVLECEMARLGLAECSKIKPVSVAAESNVDGDNLPQRLPN